MSYKITKQNDDTTYNLVELVINNVGDLTELPTSFASGSTVFVIETSDVYMLTVPDSMGNVEWKKI